MYVHSAQGQLYGFCPAKLMRGDDPEALQLYSILVVVAETGQLLEGGGISAQPAWFIDELAWFLPKYSAYKFGRQAAMVFGGGDNKPKAAASPNAAPRTATHRQRGR